ncbi:hypothetical protein ABTY61_01825 [Kitasatospora sp. NPDC096128]|uniref:hypothetical protein n=1 Tax=Kitasatospora sp. NPDC096128 TaxID=3155547 RepID=UPI00333257D8
MPDWSGGLAHASVNATDGPKYGHSGHSGHPGPELLSELVTAEVARLLGVLRAA